MLSSVVGTRIALHVPSLPDAGYWCNGPAPYRRFAAWHNLPDGRRACAPRAHRMCRCALISGVRRSSFCRVVRCSFTMRQIAIRLAAPTTATSLAPSTDRPTRGEWNTSAAAHSCKDLVARSVLSPPLRAGPAWSPSRLDRGSASDNRWDSVQTCRPVSFPVPPTDLENALYEPDAWCLGWC